MVAGEPPTAPSSNHPPSSPEYRDGAGVDGVVPSAEYHMVNTYSSEHGWDVADAIYTAAIKMSAGDVILLHDADHYSSLNSWQRTVAALPEILAAIQPTGSGSGSSTGASAVSVSDAKQAISAAPRRERKIEP